MAADVHSRRNHRNQTLTIALSVLDPDGVKIAATALTAEVLSPEDPDAPTTYTYGVDGDWANPALGEYEFHLTPDFGSDAHPWEVWLEAEGGGITRVSHVRIWVEKDRFQEAG